MAKPPTIYRKRGSAFYFCVVRTAAGKPLHQCTRVASSREQDAIWWAEARQRDIVRRAEAGLLLPATDITPAPSPRLL